MSLKAFKFFVKREIFGMKIAVKYHLKKKFQTPVFLLCHPRSGSNLFISYLAGNFTPNHEALSLSETYGLRPSASKMEALRHLHHFSNNAELGLVKIFFSDLSRRGLSVADLDREFPSAKWIILYRQNILDQYISNELAELTKIWVGKDYGETQINLCPDKVDGFRKWLVRQYAIAGGIDGLKERSLWISYEKMCENPLLVFSMSVFPFLGLPPQPVRTTLPKQNTRSYREVIANYENVSDFIAHTDFSYQPQGAEVSQSHKE